MDKSTTKLIIELYDGMVVESVLMRYEKKGDGRASLCVSSQVGCAMGCTFCATGTYSDHVFTIAKSWFVKFLKCSVQEPWDCREI